jgi:hypothetical protein
MISLSGSVRSGTSTNGGRHRGSVQVICCIILYHTMPYSTTLFLTALHYAILHRIHLCILMCQLVVCCMCVSFVQRAAWGPYQQFLREGCGEEVLMAGQVGTQPTIDTCTRLITLNGLNDDIIYSYRWISRAPGQALVHTSHAACC